MKRILPWLGMLLLAGCLQPIDIQESNLPVVKIDTGGQTIPDEPKISAKMQIIAGEGVNNVGGAPNAYDGFIGIERRGTSSQFFAKKQYGLETWDEAGEDIDVELLGLPEESDWILSAPFTDKSLVRNNLVYETARAMGYYASRQVFVEVFLNDEYQGVYVLLEQVKRDKNRVDISSASDEDSSSGYLLELECNEPDADAVYFTTPVMARGSYEGTACYFIIEYPNDEDLTPERKEYITNYVNTLEQTLFSDTSSDPETGYRKLLDVDSFVDHILLNEVFKNPDYFFRSTFLYKDDGEPLALGPVWDFDIALGNNDFEPAGSPEGFFMDESQKYWPVRLFADPAFKAAYIARYRELRGTVLATDVLLRKIDDMVTTLGPSSNRNFKRWPILGTYIWPNRFVGNSYESEVSYLKTWLETRLNWLDNNIEQVAP
jgi:spore coat protein CotH